MSYAKNRTIRRMGDHTSVIQRQAVAGALCPLPDNLFGHYVEDGAYMPKRCLRRSTTLGLWTSQNVVGSVPSMNDSSNESGQASVAT